MATITYLDSTQAADWLCQHGRPMSPQRMRYLLDHKRIKGARRVAAGWKIPAPVTVKKGKRPGRPKGSLRKPNYLPSIR